MKDKINFEQFLEISKQLEIKIGHVHRAERVPKSSKMLKLTVWFEPDHENKPDVRTVLTNMGSKYDPEQFVKQRLPFITNLEPVTMMGITSEAMIVAATNEGDPFLLNEGNNLLPIGAIVI